jgi:hypothetical protein
MENNSSMENNKSRKYFWAGFGSLIFAALFCWWSHNAFLSLKKAPNAVSKTASVQTQTVKQSTDEHTDEEFNRAMRQHDCVIAHPDWDCSEKALQPVKVTVAKPVVTQQKNGDTGNLFIPVIYGLLIIGLAVQIFLTIYTTLWLKENPKFEQHIFYISDWAVNTPPILGVLANLISFAMMLSKHGGKIQAFFGGYFYEAVITTLIGGVFYIINLALAAWIIPRLENN